MSGDGISLGWTPGEARIIGNDGQARTGWITRWSNGAFKPSLALPRPVDAVRALYKSDATLAIIVAYGRDLESQVKAVMMTNEGKVRWTRKLGEGATNSNPFMAWGPRNILLCWSETGPTTRLAPRLLCAVLNAADGSILRRPSR